jgi:hypothetical protein
MPKIWNRGKTASLTNVCKKLKLDPSLSPYTSINSKWIKYLNIRPKTLKLVQERAGNTLEVVGIGREFLNKMPAAQQLSEKMDKWDCIKLRSFCMPYSYTIIISKFKTILAGRDMLSCKKIRK